MRRGSISTSPKNSLFKDAGSPKNRISPKGQRTDTEMSGGGTSKPRKSVRFSTFFSQKLAENLSHDKAKQDIKAKKANTSNICRKLYFQFSLCWLSVKKNVL